MSKSKSKKSNAKVSDKISDEQAKEIVEVSRETEFVPEGDEVTVVNPKEPREVNYREDKSKLTPYQQLLQKQERQRIERTKQFNALTAKQVKELKDKREKMIREKQTVKK